MPVIALAQSIGRWGNFVNQEAYGSVTESLFKMRIYSEEVQDFIHVHPTFLYESVLDFCIFVMLMLLRKKRKFSGQILCLYFMLYGFGRALIEGLRTDSLMVGSLRVSQILSVLLCLGAFGVYFFVECCRPKDNHVD